MPSASRRRFLDPVGTLLVLLLLGFALRIVVAYVLLPQSGLRNDMASFSAWAIRMAELGPGGFYAAGGLVDYPPAYMYVLWLLGEIAKFFEPILGISPIRPMVKIPGIVADLGVATLVYLISVRFLGEHPPTRWLGSGARIGLIGAAVYLFNPGTVFNSAVWGQMDSVGALVILASLYALGRGWTEVAGAGAVLAVLVKFQFGWLIPIVLVVGLKRHVFGRSSDPALASRPDPVRILSSLAVAFGVAVVILLPFGMRILPSGDPATSIWDKFLAATQTYQGLSINALNWWRNPFTGIWDVQQWGSDQTVLLTIGSLSVTMAMLGVVLFAAAAILALVIVARRDDMTGLLLGALTMAVAFFGLPTRVHERYLFPALAIAAPLVGTAVRWAVAYVALSGLFFLNVYWVYSHDWTSAGDPPLAPGIGGAPFGRDPLLAATLFTQWGVWLLSLFALVLLFWIGWQALRATRTPSREVERDAEAAAEAATAAAATQAVREARGHRVLRWLRQDPVSEAERAPPRRLDRRDLALFAVIVLVALVFRLWRLDTPRQMIFDEVYHGRTATDYLSNWRWGWTRDPYEWTHPMLAKYLIAGGIVLADPNRVSGEIALDAPATALAVAPLRTFLGWQSSIVFTSDGSERIEARDVATGEMVADWDAPGRVTSLTFDPEGRRLLVGLRSSGAIATFDLSAFLATEGERAPPPETTAIETGMDGVLQVVIPLTDQLVLVRGPDEVATFERVTGVELVRREMTADAISYVAAVGGDTPVTARVVVLDVEAGTVQSLDTTTLATETTEALPAPAAGIMMTSGRGSNQLTWIPVGALAASDEHPPTDAGLTVLRGGDISVDDTVPLPGPVSAIGWDPVANLVYVAGEDAVWAIEPHGDGRSGYGVYDEVAIDGVPTGLGFDISDTSQTDDRGTLIVATDAGDAGLLTRIDVSQNAFAWRFAATLFGALLAGLVYLLTAMLFRRRSIAVLAGLFVAFDLMSYAMSRIAMNDIFVAVFLVAAYALFWPIWSGRWARSAWWVLPLVGVMIGLAAGSKWVGWYALIGLWFLVLLKSQLGRFLVVAATGFATIAIGLEAPWPFFLIMVVSLVLALAIAWIRPVRLESAELWALPASALVIGAVGLAFAIGFQTLDCGEAGCREPRSLVELGFGVLFRGIEAWWPAAIALAVTAALLLVRAIRSLRRPHADARWFSPSEMGGFAWPWIFVCLVVIPVGVYVATYIPWLSVGHAIAIPGDGVGYGWTLDELHAQMFGYHFGLQAGHAASSPWWSWPLDLKPVWFYSHSFDFDRIAVVYNGGNPALFWASVPAVLAALLLAWRRRSWALFLVAAAFAFQFVPWARVERASFQYHYLTAVIFGFIAIAYVLDEILRDRYLRDYGIAFLVAVAITGLLIYPLNSALAMPDWYVNAARTLPPWNYAFQFPDPPQGERPPLISSNPIVLMAATLLSVWSAAFASFGREWLGPRLARRAATGSAAPTERGDEDDRPDGDQADGPDGPEVQPGDELIEEEPATDEDQDRPEDDVRPGTAPDLG